MGLNNIAHGVMLEAFATVAAYVSLHSSDPGDGAANEVRGDPYRRQAVRWMEEGNGSARIAGPITFGVPGGTTITHVGYWSESTGGEFLGSRNLDAPQSYSTPGEYRLKTLVETLV